MRLAFSNRHHRWLEQILLLIMRDRIAICILTITLFIVVEVGLAEGLLLLDLQLVLDRG